jgi:hypothetical protein
MVPCTAMRELLEEQWAANSTESKFTKRGAPGAAWRHVLPRRIILFGNNALEAENQRKKLENYPQTYPTTVPPSAVVVGKTHPGPSKCTLNATSRHVTALESLRSCKSCSECGTSCCNADQLRVSPVWQWQSDRLAGWQAIVTMWEVGSRLSICTACQRKPQQQQRS